MEENTIINEPATNPTDQINSSYENLHKELPELYRSTPALGEIITDDVLSSN